ncbi:MAG: hypothetical protein O2866_01545 [archaeon]|nr:hypothetical protein [archaeon]MDA1167547.1 hypothetical protein [archaeon]
MNIDTLIDGLCWTPFAGIIRKYRQYRISNETMWSYQCKQISSLLDSIVRQHRELLN